MSIYVSLEAIRKVFDQAIENIANSPVPVADFGLPNPDLGYSFMFGGFGLEVTDKKSIGAERQVWFYPTPSVYVPGVCIGHGPTTTSPEGVINNTFYSLVVSELLDRHRHSIGMMAAGTLPTYLWIHQYFSEEFGISMVPGTDFLKVENKDKSSVFPLKGNGWAEIIQVVAQIIIAEKRDFAIRFDGDNINPVYVGIKDMIRGDDFDRAGRYRDCAYQVSSLGKRDLSCTINRIGGSGDETKFVVTANLDTITLTSLKGDQKKYSSVQMNHPVLDGELQLLTERMFNWITM